MTDLNRQYQQEHVGARAGAAYDEGLRSYMLGVYNYMALGIAATALFSMFLMTNPALTQMLRGMVWLPFIGILGLGFIAPRIIYSGSAMAGHAVYWVYVALWSVLIGPVVSLFAGAGLAGLVYQAFFITATVFGSMSLYGYTTKRDLSGWGKFLFMATVGLVLSMIVNFLFLQSGLFGFIISSLVVLVFSAVTAYETQMIKNFYQEGAQESNSRAAILGAYLLYGSFATLFINILNILGFARD